MKTPAKNSYSKQIPDEYSDVRDWWHAYNRKKPADQEQITGSTKSRVGRFLTDLMTRYIVGQTQTTLNFREIMDRGNILLVKLSQKQPPLTTFIGSLLIGQLLTAACSRDDTPEADRRQFCLYCDEFQLVATPDFAKLFTETGKYHLAPTVAHQERIGQFADEKKVLGATSAAGGAPAP